jgi:hypothetical protein
MGFRKGVEIRITSCISDNIFFSSEEYGNDSQN